MMPSLHSLSAVKPVDPLQTPAVSHAPNVLRFTSIETYPSGEFLHPYCGAKTCCAASIVTLVFWPALCCFCFKGFKCDEVAVEVENGVLVYSRGEYAGLRYRKGCCE